MMSINIPAHHAVTASQLTTWLQQHQGQAKVLSLDCFDTLLWRTVSDPKQVFSQLEGTPLYRQWRLSAATRALAELRARESRERATGNGEVTIEEIYRHALPRADDRVIEALVALEVQAEMECLFVFTPMLELMKAARHAGLKVVVASDMYIRRPHLKAMIDSSLAKIGQTFELDAWYTSADSRRTKYQGLHRLICQDLGVEPGEVLHLGDSAHADYAGARAAGVEGYYFQRFGKLLQESLKQNHSAQLMLSNQHGHQAQMACTFHPVWATLPPASNLQELLGWYYLGPLLAHFIRSLQEHVKATCDPKRKTRLVFMMRDGHMPLQACKLFRQFGFNTPNTSIHSIEVSRLSTLVGSFRGEEDLRRFLGQNAGKLAPPEVLRQLATPHDPADLFNLGDFSATMGDDDLQVLLTEPSLLQKILQHSAAQREALTRYLRQEVAAGTGDQVVLVDLGYAGTIQDHLEPLVSEAFGAEVQGYYMILRATDRAPERKHALFGPENLASVTIELLLAQVQTLEQLCCNSKGSVQGFTAKGRPVLESNLLSAEQIKLKEQIQLAATDLLGAGLRSYMALPLSPYDIFQDALGILGRFLLHPTPDELRLYERFAHDINNGTLRRRYISNPSMTREALIRGGLISFDLEYHKMFANDLVAFSPALATYSWARGRFGLRPKLADFTDHSIKFQAIASLPDDFRELSAPAFQTHEGYRVALLSIEPSMQAVGINLGKYFSWVQVHSVGLVAKRDFLCNPHWGDAVDLKPVMQAMDGQEPTPGLLHFPDVNGFVHIPLPGQLNRYGRDLILALVFRPVAEHKPMPSAPAVEGASVERVEV